MHWIIVVLAPLILAAPDAEVADVIVIGAGQAGMSAAHHLHSLGYSMRVLEATDHVGGRTRNLDVHTKQKDVATDDAFELGGTWLSPEHTAVLQLAKELGIQVYNASFVDPGRSEPPQPQRADANVGNSVSMPTGGWPWWYWGPDYPKDQMALVNATVFHSSSGRFQYQTPADFAKLMEQRQLKTTQELDAAGKLVTEAADRISDLCWSSPKVGESWPNLDKGSTAGTLGAGLTTADSEQVLRNAIHTRNAQEPESVGFLYNLFSFKGCNSGGPDNKFRVRGGTQAIPLASAALLGKNVLLNTVVQTVQSTESGVVVRTRDGVEFKGSAAIVTGPPPMVLAIDFQPPLSGAQAQVLQRMPMGTSLKFSAVYSEGPWWRSRGLQGDILATALPRNLTLPGTSIPLFVQCMDHTPFSRRYGVICCFIEGRQNLYFTTLTSKQQHALMASFLELSFGSSIPQPDYFVNHNWADQPFARGAYTGYFPSGVMSVPEYWEAYRQMQKNPGVFLAGSDYHAGFGNGYIEGAVRSGKLAAELVDLQLKQKRYQTEERHSFGSDEYMV